METIQPVVRRYQYCSSVCPHLVLVPSCCSVDKINLFGHGSATGVSRRLKRRPLTISMPLWEYGSTDHAKMIRIRHYFVTTIEQPRSLQLCRGFRQLYQEIWRICHRKRLSGKLIYTVIIACGKNRPYIGHHTFASKLRGGHHTSWSIYGKLNGNCEHNKSCI